MTILTGDCRDLMPAHGPFDLILAEPAQAAARAQVGQRYDAFVTALGRRLAAGPKLRREISEDVQPDSDAE